MVLCICYGLGHFGVQYCGPGSISRKVSTGHRVAPYATSVLRVARYDRSVLEIPYHTAVRDIA
eukprot:3455681-Rhodomonas_salina.4